MPYKDKQKQREYQKEWQRRNRAGLPTNGIRKRTKMSEEEYRLRQLESHRKYYIRRKISRKEILDQIFGKLCIFCSYEKRLVTHRKDGSPHKDFISMTKQEFKRAITTDKNLYVRLCFKCHRHVHWCMKYLNLSWEQIEKINKNPILRVQISLLPPKN